MSILKKNEARKERIKSLLERRIKEIKEGSNEWKMNEQERRKDRRKMKLKKEVRHNK